MKYLIIIAISSFLVCCDSDEADKDTHENRFLPLAIGNYWEFISSGIDAPTTIIEHREVKGKATVNEKEYFLIVSTYPFDTHLVDTLYYRIEKNGFVYQYRANPDTEENLFRLNSIDGDTWSYNVAGYTTDIQASEVVVNVNGEELENCKAYFRDVAQMADEEYTITLAPDIGFLKEYSNAWGGGQIIKAARINGEVREF